MENKPQVSILLLETGNKEALNKTMDSITAQKSVSCQIIPIVISEEETMDLQADISSASDSDKQDMPGKLYNIALEKVTTPYVMFMHEGDVLGRKFISSCVKVLEKNPDIPLAVGKSFCIDPLVKGERKEREHTLSKEYIIESGINDVTTDSAAIVITIDSSVMRTDAIKEIGFNPELPMEEDADFILKFLLKYPKYCTVPKAKYYFSQPRPNHVLYYVNAHYKVWYEDSLRNFLFPLLDLADAQQGGIPAFLQNYCMYYMNNRIMANQDNRDKKVLMGEELDSYQEAVKELFGRLDDHYILNQDELPYITKNPEIRCMYLRIKYGIDQVRYDYAVVDTEEGRDLEMRFRGNLISSMNRHYFSINMMNYVDGKLWIDGSLVSIFQYGDIKFFADFDGEVQQVEDMHSYSQTKYFGVPAYRRLPYHLEFRLDPNKKQQRIIFYAVYQGEKFRLKVSFANHWAKLSKRVRYSYWLFNKYLCHHADDGLTIKQATRWTVFKREMQLQLNLLLKHTKQWPFHQLCLASRLYFKNKRVWLMLDKLYKGGDSAEYFYRYSAKKDDGIIKYYLINEDTNDYKKLKEDGYEPLVNGSLKHKLVFINADIVLITNSNVFPFNGYTGQKSRYIRGFCNFGTMCLQHGLSVQKCAIAQRRVVDNTVMYFLASKYEYENLSKPAYGYQGFDVLKITGIARYDGLINNDQKQILLSPTWRMYNALPVTTSEGEQRGYNPEFKHSMFFKVYNGLINNERLINKARECGYKVKFLLHPILSSQVEDFTPNPELEVIPSVGDLSYEKILTESSLMVTDYSGVQFDFAYMRKPVVYFHPEELPPHYEDGVFFYDTMGFGEICTKTEQLVDLLCEYMEQGCIMKEKYRARADDFYAYDDHNNCARIYDEVLKYQQKIDKDKLRA